MLYQTVFICFQIIETGYSTAYVKNSVLYSSVIFNRIYETKVYILRVLNFNTLGALHFHKIHVQYSVSVHIMTFILCIPRFQ